MRHSKRFHLVAALLVTAIAAPAFATTHARRGPTSPNLLKKRQAKILFKAPRPRAIDDHRATQIQQALVRKGYLTGTPSGHWDTNTEAAIQKLQADNGWQTKLIPDSRAIIKLGLGPAAAGTSTAAVTEPAEPSEVISAPAPSLPANQ